MTFLPAFLSVAFAVALLIKVVLARPWRPNAKLPILIAGLAAGPAFAWWMAFNSIGSGWGFGLVAIFLSMSVGFGAILGWIWYSLTRPA